MFQFHYLPILPTIFLLSFSTITHAHIAAFGPGMYCRNGVSGTNLNSNDPVNPLYNLSLQNFWFQHDRGCDARPPTAPTDILSLPAGGAFTVQLANNQAFTNLSYDGRLVTTWPDGGTHPADWHGDWDGAECLPGGGWMHAQNESMAQGTAFAIAYNSDPTKVRLEDLVVFSVLEHTPWRLEATYRVPKKLQSCPAGGCTCAWLWVPKGCGQANMYMQGFKCQVTGVDPSVARPLAKAKPAKYCRGGSAGCVEGAKQMIVFQSQGADNVGGLPQGETPVYNEACGFRAGAQEDIFEAGTGSVSTTTSVSIVSSPSTTVRPVSSSSVPDRATTTSTATTSASAGSECATRISRVFLTKTVLITTTVTETVSSTPRRTRRRNY